MKTSFPLFARLLLWFFLNLLVLAVALWLTLRLEYGAQYHGFLPDSSRPQTQAMAQVLIGDLTQAQRERWDDVLTSLSRAYHMKFALFDGKAARLAGAALDLPPEARTMIMMTGPNGPPAFDQPPGPRLPPPPPGPPDRAPGVLLPDFPQRVIHTRDPETYWLLVHLPMDRISPGLIPAMLVGSTASAEGNPLFFNPHPWLALTAGMVVFSALFWLALTRDLTGAIGEMTRATEALAEGRFDVRAPGRRRDELGRLGSAINRMAARLKDFITGQRRFLGDAAHELCSPLARMEVALGILEEQGDERAARYLNDLREELAHMRKLAHELLSFTKASMGENHVRLEPVSVAEIVAAAIGQECEDASRVKVTVPADLQVRAHRELLLRALANLVRNAVRYAGEGGPITVAAWRKADHVIISVADWGPGVPAAELERLFDPFYRLDASRSSDTGGAGLGLAIVKTCVEACSGSVSALNQTPHGLDVRIQCEAA